MKRFAGAQFSTFKNELAELAVAKLGPITGEMRRLMADTSEIDRILKASAEKAAELAEPVLRDVKKIVGFVR
jgi:tryptophanyl-tRNA synthetase